MKDAMAKVAQDVSTFRASKDTHTRKFGDELVLLELSRGEYFSLDELGARIWDELVAGRSVGEVVEGLAADYDAPVERLRADLLTLLDDLLNRGLLVGA
jgi:hypothetical protein